MKVSKSVTESVTRAVNEATGVIIRDMAREQIQSRAKELKSSVDEAVNKAFEGAKLRFRPILMTSFAFILGVVPLITASGAGAEARKVMGMAVFAGMIVATTIGCILIPSFFVLVERKKKKDKKSEPVKPA